MGKRNRTKAAANAQAPARGSKRGWTSALAVAAIVGVLGYGGFHHGAPAPAPAPTIAELAASSFPAQGDGLTTAERRSRGPRAFSAAAKLGQGIPSSAGSAAPAPTPSTSAPNGPAADDGMTTAQRRQMGDAAFIRPAQGNPAAVASASQGAPAAAEPEPPAAADDSASDGLTIEQRARLGEAAFAKGVDGKARAKMWAEAQEKRWAVANAAAPALPPAEAADASSSIASASSSGDGLTIQQRMLLGDKAFRKGVDDQSRAKMWADATAPAAAAAPSAQSAVASASAAPAPAPSPAASGQDRPAPVLDASPPIQAAAAEPASAMQGFDATHGIEAHGTWEKNSADAEGSGRHGLLMTLAGLAALALALAWGVSAWAQKVKAGRDDGLADLAQEAGEKLDLDRAGPDFSPSPKVD